MSILLLCKSALSRAYYWLLSQETEVSVVDTTTRSSRRYIQHAQKQHDMRANLTLTWVPDTGHVQF